MHKEGLLPPLCKGAACRKMARQINNIKCSKKRELKNKTVFLLSSYYYYLKIFIISPVCSLSLSSSLSSIIFFTEVRYLFAILQRVSPG